MKIIYFNGSPNYIDFENRRLNTVNSVQMENMTRCTFCEHDYVDVWTVDARLAFEYLLPILFTYLFNFLLFLWQQWYFIKWIFRFTLFNLHIYHSHAYHKDTTQHYIFIASNSLFQLNSIQFYLLSWAFAYFILLTRVWICGFVSIIKENMTFGDHTVYF